MHRPVSVQSLHSAASQYHHLHQYSNRVSADYSSKINLSNSQEANKGICKLRVYISDLKSEVDIDCQPHDSFWHLKLCLVDRMLNNGRSPSANRDELSKTSSNGVNGNITGGRGSRSRRSNSIVSNLLSARSSSASGRSSLASRAKNVITSRRLVSTQRHSSGGSLSSTDASTCSASATNTNSASNFLQKSSTGHTTSRYGSLTQCSSRYYGFSTLNLSPWDDNARQSYDLTEDEEAAVSALVMATNGNGDSEDLDYGDEVDGRAVHDNDHDGEGDDDVDYDHHGTLRSIASSERRFSTLRDCLSPSSDDNAFHVRYDNLDRKQVVDEGLLNTSSDRSFERALTSGYLNYGFYSFSLARFLDDQALLTDYLSLVSSSSGASYYLDLEFKLKQRHQTPVIAGNFLAAPSLSSSVNTLNGVHLDVINRGQLVFTEDQRFSTKFVPATNKLLSLSFASNSSLLNSNRGTIASSTSKTSITGHEANLSASQNIANNMIARLSAGGSSTASQRGVVPQSSSQSKRKRAKVLNLLLNTNWSKQSQQPSNLIKLNKALLVCDANFVDEKTGESPLSLAINSQQINAATNNSQLSSGCNGKNGGFSQSASLFNLQCQSTSTNMSQFALQQTSISDLSQSRAPLIERILLLFIKSGALIDFRNSDGRTPLHVAAMKSNFWALKTLLDLGASTNYRDINGLTPLYYAILHKADLKVTQLLLNYNRNLASNNANTPSGNANGVISGSIGITDQQGWQEVHQACKLGLDAHLEKLLYYGCDINARISGSGNTPLHVAAINDQLECAKILLLRGADKTITNNSHQTAHQVAVISRNLDLAEFIAEHNETKVIPFRERPPNYVDMSQAASSLGNSTRSSSSLASSQSSMNMATTKQRVQSQSRQLNQMGPLTLDVAQQQGFATQPSATSVSSQAQSLLSIGSATSNQMNLHLSNISPCLSQRSCATSHTTSSSGVCCDGDGGSNSNEEIHSQKASSSDKQSAQHQQSNITVIAISNKILNYGCAPGADSNQQDTTVSRQLADEMNKVEEKREDDGDEDDDLKSSGSGSSSNGLYSLMSEERPLFTGSIVEATSEYQSGDPNHLQLRRGDLIEVLECRPDLLIAGQLPRIANKPMIYGYRKSDGLTGLFPSFCVQRTRNHRKSLRQRLAMADISNQKSSAQNIRGANIPESFSMAAINNCKIDASKLPQQQLSYGTLKPDSSQSEYRELQVTLKRSDEGFGFVLRGARINPTTLAATNGQNTETIIDERLMAANNLASLQYLDDIEPSSVAHKAGLRRGDFLVAVNNQDVRLQSHEQVVQMIRQSGAEVLLTIAAPVGRVPHPNFSSKTLVAKVKPEPPKRDPTTTLTRNKTQRVNSMVISQSHKQSELFDANKPLPMAPSVEPQASPTGSLNMMDRSRTSSLTQFCSAQSLSGSLAESQSISSFSATGIDQQQHSQQVTPNHSSSSTATLTTVATMKPQPPKKPGTIQMNSDQQPVYQPAVITTTRRISQPSSTPHSSPGSSKNGTTVAATSPVATDATANDSKTVPSVPPPPPPMPKFSPIQQPANRLFQRRTSAPVNQTTGIVIDSNRLQKKRESLVAVSQKTQLSAPISAQFGEVAAACAAAANSRMLRQRQQQQEQQQPDDQRKTEQIEMAQPTVVKSNFEKKGSSKQQSDSENEKQTTSANEVKQQKPAFEQPRAASPPPATSVGTLSAVSSASPRQTMLDRQQLSATLGRSSAQVIQHPKPHNSHSQSQTMRTKPKRPAIPSYDDLPPPMTLAQEPGNSLPAQSKQMIGTAMPCQLHHHNHQQQKYQNESQMVYHVEMANGIKQRNQQGSLIKTQPAPMVQNLHGSHHHHHHQRQVLNPIENQHGNVMATANLPINQRTQTYLAQQGPLYQQHPHHHHHHYHHHNQIPGDRVSNYQHQRDILSNSTHTNQVQAQNLYAAQQQQQLAKLHQQHLIQQQLRQQYLLQQQQQIQAHYSQDKSCSSSKHTQHDMADGHRYPNTNDHNSFHQHQVQNHPQHLHQLQHSHQHHHQHSHQASHQQAAASTKNKLWVH